MQKVTIQALLLALKSKETEARVKALGFVQSRDYSEAKDQTAVCLACSIARNVVLKMAAFKFDYADFYSQTAPMKKHGGSFYFESNDMTDFMLDQVFVAIDETNSGVGMAGAIFSEIRSAIEKVLNNKIELLTNNEGGLL